MSALHRWMNLAGVLLPFLGFVIAVVLLWNTLVDWSDLAVMLIMYVISGFGVTVGFHRLLTHRSFQTYKPVEYDVRDPRLDRRPGPGDVVGRRPSQAPRAHRRGGRSALAARARRRAARRDPGLWYAHMGWLFHGSGQSEHARYARDLSRTAGMRLIHRLFPLWVALGIAIRPRSATRSTGRWPAPRRRRCGAGRCGSSRSTT